MAIIRNLASMMLKGKIGDTSYYVSQSRQLARQALNNSNYGETASRTDVQQNRRVRWANLVNFYSGNKAWMKKAYENLNPGVSIFNRFIQLNINSASVALTRGEAQAKIWVPASYRVSQGSLKPLSFSYIEGKAVLALQGVPDIDLMATVADVSQAILAANPTLRNGDAIACIKFLGTRAVPGSSTGMNPASYIYREYVIDTQDTAVSQEKYPGWVSGDGGIMVGEFDNSDAVVFIHTRKSSGKLYVSTQDMVVKTESITNADAWRSDAQFTKAIKSYGESTTVPLAPGGSTNTESGNDSSTGADDENQGGTNVE